MRLAPPASLLTCLALALAGCSQERKPAPASGALEGRVGEYYYVNLFTPPIGGVVTSDVGGISCGAARLGTPIPDAHGVLQYQPAYYAGADRCGQTRFAWSQQVVLSATPREGNAFLGWAGDCSGLATCTLVAGSDKTVVAIFGPPGGGHYSVTSPADHGPLFLASLARTPGSLQCQTCHGATLDGVGLAPSCNACHAAAGWASWQTNCTFCHGTRSAATKASIYLGHTVQDAAPGDTVASRLHRSAPPAFDAHAGHRPLGTGLAQCQQCHPFTIPYGTGGAAIYRTAAHVDGMVSIGFGPLASQGTTASLDPATKTCANYCHGATLDGATLRTPRWTQSDGAAKACGACHAMPPGAPHPQGEPSCGTCHYGYTATSVGPGHVDGSARPVAWGPCTGCHATPPQTGAHAAHFQLDVTSIGYGDLERTGSGIVYGSAPTTLYAFGCGFCHPLDVEKHMNRQVDVELFDPGAPIESLKARARVDASYDRATGTCSGTYCHSSGQANPVAVVTPAWFSGEKTGCGSCHGNPPRYASGGAGTDTANSHLGMNEWGREFGHYHGPTHWGQHGGAWAPTDDAAPVTCQTCHARTAGDYTMGYFEPFYWIDTSGDYVLPGGEPGRYSDPTWVNQQCATCHFEGGRAAPGPAKPWLNGWNHVNGQRDVAFDDRTEPWPVSWLPAAPNTPTRTYWLTNARTTVPWPADVTWNGTTVSFDLANAAYDPATKTCTSVACHLQGTPVWGRPYLSLGMSTEGVCYECHGNLWPGP